MNQLHAATGRLRSAVSLEELLPAILDGALELTGADFGDLQLVDPLTMVLRMVTSSGLDDEFVEHFTVVDDARTACGLAVRRRQQIAVPDFLAEPAFAAHRQAVVAADVRAVLSTPLLDFAGNVLGVVSTHHREPELPDPRVFRLVELLADVAGERLATRLHPAAGQHRSGAVPPARDDAGLAVLARAVIAALLSPDVVGPGGPDSASPNGGRRRPFRDAFPSDELSEVADLVVTRLFAVSLQLDGARSVLAEHQASGRLFAAAGDLDGLIDDIRAAMIARNARHGE